MTMFDRTRHEQKRVLRKLHDSAVHQAQTPGTARIGVAGNGATALTSIEGGSTYPDEDGNTIRPFLYGVDNPRTDPVYVVTGYPTIDYTN